MANKAKKKPKKLSKKEAAAQAREKQAAAAARRAEEARELLLREEAASREAAEEQRAQEQRARREEEEAAAKAAQAKAEQEEAQASSERAQAWWAVLGHSLDSWWFRWFARKDPRAVQVVQQAAAAATTPPRRQAAPREQPPKRRPSPPQASRPRPHTPRKQGRPQVDPPLPTDRAFEAAVSVHGSAREQLDAEHEAWVSGAYGEAAAIYAGMPNTSVAVTYHNMALAMTEQQQHSKAIELFSRALAIKKKVLGPRHPETARTCSAMASAFAGRSKKSDEAAAAAGAAGQHQMDEAQVRQLFRRIDEDGGGSLDRTEVEQLLVKLGVLAEAGHDETLVDTALQAMDADGEGTVSVDEFLGWWETARAEHREHAQDSAEDFDSAAELFATACVIYQSGHVALASGRHVDCSNVGLAAKTFCAMGVRASMLSPSVGRACRLANLGSETSRIQDAYKQKGEGADAAAHYRKAAALFKAAALGGETIKAEQKAVDCERGDVHVSSDEEN